MICRTTNEIIDSSELLKRTYKKDTRSEEFWNPILLKEFNRVWVDLESLQKDIEGMIKHLKIRYNEDKFNKGQSHALNELRYNLCNSSEQNKKDLPPTSSVSGEQTGEDDDSVKSVSSSPVHIINYDVPSRVTVGMGESSPVQNPQKKCTCLRVRGFDDMPFCGRCGGKL